MRVGVGCLVRTALAVPRVVATRDGVASGSVAWQAADKAAPRINIANSLMILNVASISTIVAPVASQDKLPSSIWSGYALLIGFRHLPITAQDHQYIVFSARL